MTYRYLIPSMIGYAQKFKQLNSLDLKIIKAMYRHGFSNITKIAEMVDVPQQTASYRVNRLLNQDIIRFRALTNETRLGLKSYSVFARTPPDKEATSSCAMTCFPLWRYLAILDGWMHGNYVRYAIPSDKERDLQAFLSEIKNRGLISSFKVFSTTSPNYPLLNVDFYIENKSSLTFNWDEWLAAFDSFPETELSEPITYKKAEFDMYDLIILRCFEINARSTQRNIVKEIAGINDEKRPQKLIPLVSRRIKERISAQELITGYRAYLIPNPASATLFFMFFLDFSNSSNLKKFISGLSYLPYNTGYEKILGQNTILLRVMIPGYEYSNMRMALTKLAERGCIKGCHLFLGDLVNGTWDNVEIYKMFKDGAWSFSYGKAMEMLEAVL